MNIYEYKTEIGDDIASAEQLNSYGADRWELVQIVPHSAGMQNIKPGQFAHYFRRVRQTETGT